jgi:hypothetical protein
MLAVYRRWQVGTIGLNKQKGEKSWGICIKADDGVLTKVGIIRDEHAEAFCTALGITYPPDIKEGR